MTPGQPPVGSVWDGATWVPPRRRSGCWSWGCLLVLVAAILVFLGGAASTWFLR